LYRNLNRSVAAASILTAVFFAAVPSIRAQDANSAITMITATPAALSMRPAEFQSLAERRWEMGPFVNYGNGVGDRSDYHFFALGFQLSRSMFPVVHAGPLSGRFEFGGNIMPLFQAYTPAPHTEVVDTPDGQMIQQIGGGTFTGVSVTPVVFRWNFAPESRRFTPWFQAQAGVLWTNHKFPPTIEVPEGTPGGTSVFNFRSGAGVGFHYFTRPRRSLDFALNAEHISSASLGDKNPGVNASLQLQLGYTWWK
jgi:lipid A 3-O-deacylase